MKKGTLIVISGPSGVGKDTICNELIRKNSDIQISVSMTTRDKRPGEEEGINYYYVSKEEFESHINNDDFIEYANVYGNYYGTPKSKVNECIDNGKNILLVLDIQGALNVKQIYKNAIFIFILPPNMRVLYERIKARGITSKEVVVERFKSDYKLVNEYSKYNYAVVNDNLDDAVKKIEAIILASSCSVDRIEALDLGNEEEMIHEILTSN